MDTSSPSASTIEINYFEKKMNEGSTTTTMLMKIVLGNDVEELRRKTAIADYSLTDP